LVNLVYQLTENRVGLIVLTGQGAAIDITTASGKLVFGIFAALAEVERELITEAIKAGLESARALGRKGRTRREDDPREDSSRGSSNVRSSNARWRPLQRFGISRRTHYRYVSPEGAPRYMEQTARSSGS